MQACGRLPGFPSGLAEKFLVPSTYLFRDCADYEGIFLDDFKARRRSLDILSVGCATGAEVYSMAIFCEDAGIPAFVTGCDLSRAAIDRAGEGIYDFAAKEDLLACSDSAGAGRRMDRYARFFEPVAADSRQMRVIDAVRKQVRFVRVDACEMSFAKAFDFVVCRKMLYYLPMFKRRRALENMLRALKDGRGWEHIVFDGYTRKQPFFQKLYGEYGARRGGGRE